MKCPACDIHIEIEDWQNPNPFHCCECGQQLLLHTDESTYTGATDTKLIILDED